MSFAAFIEKQASVYEKFATARSELLNGGSFLPDQFVTESKGAYLIGIRPPSDLQPVLDAFAIQLKKLGGFIAYDRLHRHTTFSDYGVKKDFVSSDLDRKKIGDVSLIIKAELASMPAPCCQYSGFTFNASTVILKGQPNEAFLAAALMVTEIGHKFGLELRLPWGSHITLARRCVTGDRAEVVQLNQLCDEFDTKLPSGYQPLGPLVSAELAFAKEQLHFMEL